MNEFKTNNITVDVTTQADHKERQPWQRPTLKRLRLSLDTASDIGSSSDGQILTFGVD